MILILDNINVVICFLLFALVFIAWNRLLTELKPLRSMDLFRCDLKTFLFHSVYGHQDTN